MSQALRGAFSVAMIAFVSRGLDPAASGATDGQSTASASTVVPYSAMDVSQSEYRLGYDVSLPVDGKPPITQALPLAALRVTKDERREMRPRTARGSQVVVDEVISASVGGSRISREIRRSERRLRSLTKTAEATTSEARTIGGLYPYFKSGIDTISAAGAGTNLTGHDYYSASTKVLTAIELLLTYGCAPAKRVPPLGSRTSMHGRDQWSFLPLQAEEVVATVQKVAAPAR